MKEESKQPTDYEKYIRTQELLSLQKEEEELCCEDELTFQTVHQIAELHFKLILQYLDRSCKSMQKGDAEGASLMLDRVIEHLRQLPQVFDLVKSITPADYHTIRLFLGRGSGQDSPGFNSILKEGPKLWEPFEQLLNKENRTVLQLLEKPDSNRMLYRLLKNLLTFDEYFQTFRHSHIQLVRRMIGLRTKSLKGIPAQALERGAKHEFYPLAWDAVCELTDLTGSSYDPKPL
ncbi:tryptophan 2,3-dioxygenase [Bacillus infantis]|uniref:tryptophan 2,3-dioxygenase family protein n=1 Tax=Bacillus infantis TaxID=324767 RepID=UPI001CD74253|nr:tryptophan 2,3-dioxygenase family protein [Bacillus infantis]MCA1037956.1 tryptophan 2,3-dioxygenase [Bacillus infantis]